MQRSPEELVLHGVQPGSTALGPKLTTPVATALDPLIDAVEAELAAWLQGSFQP